jgi:mannose-6-phosphate isomerase-like protein (cupin superfamily)
LIDETLNTVAQVHGVRGAHVVLPCSNLDETLKFFVGDLGFRVDAIWPADGPHTAVISGHGARIKLALGATGSAGVIQIACDDPMAIAKGETLLTAPNGTVIELVHSDAEIEVPPGIQSLIVSRASRDDEWGVGRAGMRYRDLISDRQGGRFIASHIHIANGGPVPDYVHFHKIRFQMIFCHRGWVRVVYEDQGEPFVMQAGDCVLQPPRIRHRVLESSDDLKVIEIGCPAEHETIADHLLALPTPAVNADRDFSGQKFVRHVAAGAQWRSWRHDGYEYRDTGIGAATGALAEVRVVRPNSAADATSSPKPATSEAHSGEFYMMFVLNGSVTVSLDGEQQRFGESDCVTIPAKMRFGISEPSSDCEILEVALPQLS